MHLSLLRARPLIHDSLMTTAGHEAGRGVQEQEHAGLAHQGGPPRVHPVRGQGIGGRVGGCRAGCRRGCLRAPRHAQRRGAPQLPGLGSSEIALGDRVALSWLLRSVVVVVTDCVLCSGAIDSIDVGLRQGVLRVAPRGCSGRLASVGF